MISVQEAYFIGMVGYIIGLMVGYIIGTMLGYKNR